MPLPLGTTSQYCGDVVSTTELIYNLMLGFNCNHSNPKLGYDILVPSWCFAYSVLLQLRPLLSSNVDYEDPSISML